MKCRSSNTTTSNNNNNNCSNLNNSSNVIYRHYNLPIIFPYMAFLGDNWIIDDTLAVNSHFHNCIELGYCKNGNGTIYIENNEFSFHANDYIFIPENVAHMSQAQDGSTSNWEYIYFDPYLLFQNSLPIKDLDNILSELPNHYGVISSDTDKELHFLISLIFSEYHKKEPYYQDSLKGLFISLITLAARSGCHEQISRSDFQWLYASLSYIRSNYHKKLSIAEIAKNCCGLSESHFRKKFNEIMRIGPLDYINHLRIRIACQSVYNREKAINEIACDVGFPTLSSFNRNFHSLLKCSPSEWRAQQAQCDDVMEITSMDRPEVHSLFMP